MNSYFELLNLKLEFKLMTKLGWFSFLGILFTFSCSRPISNFYYQGETKAPAWIHFDNKSDKAVAFEWDFGDGNTSKEVAPKHKYRASGNYTVILKAINEKNKSTSIKKELLIEAPDKCLIEIETTYGDMLLELYDATPKHQDNFVKLVEQGYFDSLLFHRVIDGFMIQGGDPKSKHAKVGQPLGSGGPGYRIPAEFVDSLIHVKGALAAARTGGPTNPKKESSGSQFYIVQGQALTENELDKIEAQKGIRYSKSQRQAYLEKGGTPFLDREYTVFGRIIEGLEVVDKIAKVKKDSRDRPRENVRMKIRFIR